MARCRLRIRRAGGAWPGIGHAAKQGDGFRWYPAPMEMTKL
jgi:hypothetical protein